MPHLHAFNDFDVCGQYDADMQATYPGMGERQARWCSRCAGSNTAADHITVVRAALRQLPTHRSGRRPGRRVLIRIDGAGATHDLLGWLTGQRRSYSVGFTLPADFATTWPRSRPVCGPRPTTATARSGTGPGLPRPPA